MPFLLHGNTWIYQCRNSKADVFLWTSRMLAVAGKNRWGKAVRGRWNNEIFRANNLSTNFTSAGVEMSHLINLIIVFIMSHNNKTREKTPFSFECVLLISKNFGESIWTLNHLNCRAGYALYYEKPLPSAWNSILHLIIFIELYWCQNLNASFACDVLFIEFEELIFLHP